MLTVFAIRRLTTLSPSICIHSRQSLFVSFFFFNDPATTEIYTLSLHDALPISRSRKTREISGPEPHSPSILASASTCPRSEEHTSELQSHSDLVCRLLLEKKKIIPMSYGYSRGYSSIAWKDKLVLFDRASKAYE